MPTIVENDLEQFKRDVVALSKEGRYGEAVARINDATKANIYLMASDSDDLKDFINGWICGDALCNCCDGCSNNGCFGAYCLSFIAVFFCCGEDVASTCCGCDWMVDTSSSCVRDQCC